MSNTLIAKIAAVSVLLTAPSAFAADGDAANGEKLFKRCAACHKIGPDAKNGVGPALTGVVGRAAGSYEGYKYSKSVVAANEKGLIWTEEELDKYLTHPTKYLRTYLDDKKARSKMSFRLKKEEERADMIAYLKSVTE